MSELDPSPAGFLNLTLVSWPGPQLKVSRHECQGMAEKLAAVELKLHDADRRTEALATLQSHRWMEFSKMADSMKELSQNMLSQSKTNTRRAAIRADLDEELQDL